MLNLNDKYRVFKTAPFSRKRALRASLLLSFMLNSIMVMGIYYGRMHSPLIDAPHMSAYLRFSLWQFCCNAVLFYIIFAFNFAIIRSGIRKGAVYIISGDLALCLIMSPMMAQLQWMAIGSASFSIEEFMLFNVIADLVACIIIMVVTSNIYLNFKRGQAVLANQRLREENMRARYEALKNQLDPHFLFNSLNTLNGLIDIDHGKAHDYLDNLSSVFRYTLHSKDICRLDEELDYVDTYISLLKIRFGDSLHVKYNVAAEYRGYYIMPVSLQLLVENAVKHNVISNKTPLLITIGTTDLATVRVSNRINPKTGECTGGVGLANLSDRYSILFGQDITVSDADGMFSVEIPLIGETDKNTKV